MYIINIFISSIGHNGKKSCDEMLGLQRWYMIDGYGLVLLSFKKVGHI